MRMQGRNLPSVLKYAGRALTPVDAPHETGPQGRKTLSPTGGNEELFRNPQKSPTYQPVEKRDLRRCASFLVSAAYHKYALFLEIRAPCISSFLNRLQIPSFSTGCYGAPESFSIFSSRIQGLVNSRMPSHQRTPLRWRWSISPKPLPERRQPPWLPDPDFAPGCGPPRRRRFPWPRFPPARPR